MLTLIIQAKCFNSRSRVGSDMMRYSRAGSRQRFQFALPRGERPHTTDGTHSGDTFQFALPRGERRPAAISSFFLVKFQFALPRGERHKRHKNPCRRSGFNSRSRVGSDRL